MRTIALSLALSFLAACGGDDDDNSAVSNKKLSELTADELTGVCDRVDGQYRSFEELFVSVSCTEQARADASTCTQTRQQCVESTDADGALEGMVEFECKGGTNAITVECAQITVAELDGCIDDILAGLSSLADQFTCTADQSDLKLPTTPSACSSLGARCPMFAEFSFE